MKRETKLTLAMAETALGTAGLLTAVYGPLEDKASLGIGLAGIALSLHGTVTSTKISNEITDERLEKYKETMDNYANAYAQYTRRKLCGF